MDIVPYAKFGGADSLHSSNGTAPPIYYSDWRNEDPTDSSRWMSENVSPYATGPGNMNTAGNIGPGGLNPVRGSRVIVVEHHVPQKPQRGSYIVVEKPITKKPQPTPYVQKPVTRTNEQKSSSVEQSNRRQCCCIVMAVILIILVLVGIAVVIVVIHNKIRNSSFSKHV